MAAVPSSPDDVDRIMLVMERAFDPCFGEAWNRRQVSDALVFGGCHCGLIAADGRPAEEPGHPAVGFYLSRTAYDEEELLLFAVDPSHRARGLGGRLLRAFIDAASRRGAGRLFLEMRRNNPAASIYAVHGFRPIGVRPAYYRTTAGPVDAISYEKILA